MVADAILSHQIDAQSRDATFMPKLTETADKVIPTTYATLKKIADKHGLPYPAEFERANYQSIFDVVEKFGRLGPYAPPDVHSPPPDTQN